MFNRIVGTLTGKAHETLFVMTQGLEWSISVPSRAIDSFGQAGDETEVFVWLHHYEDGMRLFGFPSGRERDLFLDLTKVEGVGPKQALKILSGISPSDLVAALDAGDLATLQRIPGVGPKLAQKMVLALKGKLVEPGSAVEGAESTGSKWDDVVAALAGMGFDKKAAESAVRRRAHSIAAGPEGERELFRLCLVDLSAGGAS